MANIRPTTIEALDADATGTRVVFQWRDDRFHHAIYCVRLGQAALLAESIEGDAVNPWPPSPPLQQLHKQPRDIGGEILFATGMAGTSHWSGSVSTSADQHSTEVTFEFACRHRAPPDWLGVTYRIADGVQAELKRQNEVLLTIQDSLEYAIGGAAAPMNSATELIPITSVSLTDRTVRIAAKQSAIMTSAITDRWAYAVRLAQPL